MKLNIATCQFPVDRSIPKNLSCVERQLKSAKARGAHVVHFSEACLSGYAGVEFDSFATFDWDRLGEAMAAVIRAVRRLRVWVVIGSSHRLSGRHKPHNSLYIINPRGRIIDRYDKMFCTGNPKGTSGDLNHFTPGNHFTVFNIRGFRCGALICHDFRYDELYRRYKQHSVQVMFHSYHNAHRPLAQRQRSNIHGVIVPPTMQTYAANNHMWISANNSSKAVSSWSSFSVRPDGTIAGRLPRERSGILMTTVDTNTKFYDASSHWRDRAISGVYHSGRLVRDKRSQDRTCV